MHANEEKEEKEGVHGPGLHLGKGKGQAKGFITGGADAVNPGLAAGGGKEATGTGERPGTRIIFHDGFSPLPDDIHCRPGVVLGDD
jgi:hypothetical protein